MSAIAERELAGELSAAERARMDRPATVTIDEARDHYELMLQLTRRAARELSECLDLGVPRRGSSFARRLANSYAWASVSLARAAAELVRLEKLPDDGRAEGIIHEVLL